MLLYEIADDVHWVISWELSRGRSCKENRLKELLFVCLFPLCGLEDIGIV